MEGGGLLASGKSHASEGVGAAARDLIGRKAHVGGPVGDVLKDGLGKELPLGMLHHVPYGPIEASPVALAERIDAIDHDVADVGYLERAKKA
jgi:hypothetical protein